MHTKLLLTRILDHYLPKSRNLLRFFFFFLMMNLSGNLSLSANDYSVITYYFLL